MATPLDHPALEAIPSDAPSERRFGVSLSESEMATMLAALGLQRSAALLRHDTERANRCRDLIDRLTAIAEGA